MDDSVVEGEIGGVERGLLFQAAGEKREFGGGICADDGLATGHIGVFAVPKLGGDESRSFVQVARMVGALQNMVLQHSGHDVPILLFKSQA